MTAAHSRLSLFAPFSENGDPAECADVANACPPVRSGDSARRGNALFRKTRAFRSMAAGATLVALLSVLTLLVMHGPARAATDGTASASASASASAPSPSPAQLPAMSLEEMDELLRDEGPLVISIMTSWCPPCRQELPRLNGIYKKLADRGLKMVGLSLDYSPKAMAKMVADNDVAFPFYWVGEAAMTKHGIRGIPLIIIVRGGAEVERVEGLHPTAELMQIFETYLED